MTVNLLHTFFDEARRLIGLYKTLHEANTTFLKDAYSTDKLNSLLEQREISFQEVKKIEDELISLSTALFVDLKLKNLPEVIVQIEKSYQEGKSIAEACRTSLNDLVVSDKAVQECLSKEKAGITKQIKVLRRGSAVIKGYRQSDPKGSCFFDKIK